MTNNYVAKFVCSDCRADVSKDVSRTAISSLLVGPCPFCRSDLTFIAAIPHSEELRAIGHETKK